MTQSVSRWLSQKFLAWQNETGERQSLKNFAQYIGIKPTTLSSWLNADVIPTGDNVHLLAAKLGPEIYEVLGVQPPAPAIIFEAKAVYDTLTPGQKANFEKKLDEWLKSNGFHRVK